MKLILFSQRSMQVYDKIIFVDFLQLQLTVTHTRVETSFQPLLLINQIRKPNHFLKNEFTNDGICALYKQSFKQIITHTWISEIFWYKLLIDVITLAANYSICNVTLLLQVPCFNV